MLTNCYIRTILHRILGHEVYEVARLKGGWTCSTCFMRSYTKRILNTYPTARFYEDGKEVYSDKHGRKRSNV